MREEERDGPLTSENRERDLSRVEGFQFLGQIYSLPRHGETLSNISKGRDKKPAFRANLLKDTPRTDAIQMPETQTVRRT